MTPTNFVPLGWDHPETAWYYEAFNNRHDRYRIANDHLTMHADLHPGHRVLDVGAGTGLTAQNALNYLGSKSTIVCVEPSRVMRESGMSRIQDKRVVWAKMLPDTN